MASLTDQRGRLLGERYEIEAVIGTGVSARVYRARDRRLGRAVALKVLHPGLAADDSFLRCFQAEARTVAALSHPNLVRLFDWGVEDSQAYLVLEYLAGGSLRDLLDDGQLLSVPQAAEIGAQAAHGLAYAHRRGLLHRDIKPANLLFDEEGVVRVADFGLARALADASWTEPVGAVLGTTRYASPELAEGRVLSSRSDVYSLALVLYEAVVGEVPFRADTTVGTLMARIGAALPASRALGPLYPVLAQGAIPNPIARFDAAEFASSLESLVGELGAPPRLSPRRAATLEEEPSTTSFEEPGTDFFERRTQLLPSTRPAAALRPSSPQLYDGGSRTGPHLYDGAADLAEPDWDEDFEEDEGEDPTRPRHRVGRMIFALLLALGTIAGGVFAAMRYVVYSHVVPGLVATARSSATARTAAAGLRLEVTGHHYALSAPGIVLSQTPAPGQRVRASSVVDVTLSLGPAPVAVPLVEKMPESMAAATLGAVHLTPTVREEYSETVPKGLVVVQSPAHRSVRYGSRVIVVVSLGPSPRTIPGLAGSTWASARADLVALRLLPVESLAYSNSVPKGEVVSSVPAVGTTGIEVGSHVAVTVSRGPQLVAVPSVAGQSIDSAVSTLEAAGLVVSEVVGPPFATSTTTTVPAPGTLVAPGSALTLYGA